MASNNQIVTGFVLYEGEDILVQGSFQSQEEIEITQYSTSGRGEIIFEHSSDKTTCWIDVLFSINDSTNLSFKLSTPVREYCEWRIFAFEPNYKLHYFSQNEEL